MKPSDIFKLIEEVQPETKEVAERPTIFIQPEDERQIQEVLGEIKEKKLNDMSSIQVLLDAKIFSSTIVSTYLRVRFRSLLGKGIFDPSYPEIPSINVTLPSADAIPGKPIKLDK